jgi:hypothetical protein
VGTAFYYESLLGGMLARNADGKPELLLPIVGSRLALIAAEGIGRTALAIFRHPEYIGRTVRARSFRSGRLTCQAAFGQHETPRDCGSIHSTSD